MPTQNLLRLLLLLMLMMRIVLATVCCRFGSWGLVIKLHFCSDLEHKVWSGFWSWSSGEILKLKFGQYFAADVWLRLRSWILVNILKLGLLKIFTFSRDADVLLRFWSWCLVEILQMKFDQDLCLNLWYDLSKLLGQLNLTLRSFVPLAMFYTWIERIAWQSLAVHIRQQNPDKSALIVRQGAGLVTHQVPCLFTSKLLLLLL